MTSLRKCIGWSKSMLDSHICMTKTRLINFDPLNPTFYYKTGVNRGMHYFSYFCSKQDCRYPLEPPQRGGSNEYPQSVLSRNLKKYQNFYPKMFSIWRWSIYLNRRVSVIKIYLYPTFRNLWMKFKLTGYTWEICRHLYKGEHLCDFLLLSPFWICKLFHCKVDPFSGGRVLHTTSREIGFTG